MISLWGWFLSNSRAEKQELLVPERGVMLNQGYNLGMRSEESDIGEVDSNPSGFTRYSRPGHSEKEGNASRSTDSAKGRGNE